MGQKIRPWVLEDFLGPKVTTPQIWGSAEISDTKKKFFYVCTKTMPNLKSVLQIVVEIDGGGEATRTQTGLHQNRLPMLKICKKYVILYFLFFKGS